MGEDRNARDSYLQLLCLREGVRIYCLAEVAANFIGQALLLCKVKPARNNILQRRGFGTGVAGGLRWATGSGSKLLKLARGTLLCPRDEQKGAMRAASCFASDAGYSAVSELRLVLPTLTLAIDWCTPGGREHAHAREAMLAGLGQFEAGLPSVTLRVKIGAGLGAPSWCAGYLTTKPG